MKTGESESNTFEWSPPLLALGVTVEFSEQLRREYERGFVEGIQEQMRRIVEKQIDGYSDLVSDGGFDPREKALHKQPTKIFGPDLEGILNSAGFFRKREWVGLTRDEFEQCYEAMGEPMNDWALGEAIAAKLKEKNT